jgi:hypothetical protein
MITSATKGAALHRASGERSAPENTLESFRAAVRPEPPDRFDVSSSRRRLVVAHSNIPAGQPWAASGTVRDRTLSALREVAPPPHPGRGSRVLPKRGVRRRSPRRSEDSPVRREDRRRAPPVRARRSNASELLSRQSASARHTTRAAAADRRLVPARPASSFRPSLLGSRNPSGAARYARSSALVARCSPVERVRRPTFSWHARPYAARMRRCRRRLDGVIHGHHRLHGRE